jgi:hypothetical protein
VRSFRLAFLVILAVAGNAMGLEVQEGRIRIELQEQSGRVAFYYLSEGDGKKFIPLLIAEDPRTTSLTILDNNRAYVMGESSGFVQSVEQTASGVRYDWVSGALRVEQEFIFVASPSSALADGVRIDITVRNTSARARNVGVRYILDTYLGENGGNHFATPSLSSIERETSYLKGNVERYWVSRDIATGLGVRVVTTGEGITTPEKIVFANWKRLSETLWDYQVVSSRNFNMLPYSINDSAVGQFYGPRSLEPGASIKVTMVLGADNPDGFSLRPVSQGSAVTEILEKATAGPEIEDPELSLREDLATLDDLLEQIDRLLASGSVGADDMELIEQVIAELKRKHL